MNAAREAAKQERSERAALEEELRAARIRCSKSPHSIAARLVALSMFAMTSFASMNRLVVLGYFQESSHSTAT